METRLCLVSTEKNVKCRCRSIFFNTFSLNRCCSVAPSSRENVWKSLLLLCFGPMAAAANSMVNRTGSTVQHTQFSSTVSCKKKRRKRIVCGTDAEQMLSKPLMRYFCSLLPLYTKLLQDQYCTSTRRESLSGT